MHGGSQLRHSSWLSGYNKMLKFDGLSAIISLFTFLEAETSQVKTLADLVFDLWFPESTFCCILMCLRGSKISGVLSYKDTNHFLRAPSS